MDAYSKRIILHVGMPKTGSTALQHWCHNHRNLLAQHGITYPESYDFVGTPRHQYLSIGLMHNNFDVFDRHINSFTNGTLLLSNEGLTNHLYDFRADVLQSFRQKMSMFEVVVFIVTREQNAWMKSYYKQSVINPPVCDYGYATPLSYMEYCKTPRMLKLSNVDAICSIIGDMYGADHVVIAKYEENWMQSFLDLLDVSEVPDLPRENISLSDDLIELIRQINAMNLSVQERNDSLSIVQKCFAINNIMLSGAYMQKKACDPQLFQNLQPQNAVQADLIKQILIFNAYKIRL